ncbi:MAG: dihydroneopterin aldolase [Betaproteobacteria bacterium]|nr:MAG: dihydroneopterin aldolase [Betaproteobacteria bacterium]
MSFEFIPRRQKAPPLDIIFIKGLKCETTLGVYDWERVSLRPVLLDLEIGSASNESFEHDSAKGLMNYDSISKRLTAALTTLHYKTVERLAEHVAQIVLDEFHAPYVKLTVGKPAAVKNAAMVGVTIERRVP